MFKTFLNLFGNVFGLFEEKWKFFHFSDLFPSFEPPACTGQNFFPKKYLKTSSTLVWKLLRTFLDTFRNSIFFNFFSNFHKFWSPGCTGQEKFGKNHLKRNLDTFGNVFRDFEKLNFFSFFFEIFRFLDPSGCTGQIFLPEKIPRSMLKTKLNNFGNVFGHFENWKFSSFLKFFPVWTFQGAQGNFFPENYLKTSLKFVWTLLGPFLDTFEISNFCRFFFRIFPSFDPPACTGQNFFPEKYLKTISTLVWKTFKNVLGHF